MVCTVYEAFFFNLAFLKLCFLIQCFFFSFLSKFLVTFMKTNHELRNENMANKGNHYIRHVCSYLLRPKDDIYVTHRPFKVFSQIVCEHSMFLGIPRRFPKLFWFCTHQFWKHKITLNFHQRVRVSNLTLSQL